MECEADHAKRLAVPPDAGFQQSPARISLSGARAAYVGPGLDLAPHRTAVAVVVVSGDAPFELAFPGAGAASATYETRHTALIPPGRLHHLRARGPMAFIYLDALGDDHAGVRRADLDAARTAFVRAPMVEWSLGFMCVALGLPQRPAPDPRIAAVFRALDHGPDAFARFEDVAASLALSPSRSRALIRRAAGLPFRRYRLWRRMACAARSLSEGQNLTEAAHTAGFASSAHFSAAFKSMFGLAPSNLLKAGVTFDLA